MSEVLFFLAAIAAITGAIGVVAMRNPFYAVLALVCHLVSLAALFLLLRAEFVAAAQVVVYAGAVMVLYVFVVAYVGGAEEIRSGNAMRVLGPLFAVAIAIELCIALLGSALSGINSQGAPYKLGFGTPAVIGKLFLTDYLFVFEVASLLLLVAAIGAIVLARRRRGLEDDDGSIARVIGARRPSYTGTMAEGAGVRQVWQAIEASHGGMLEVGGAESDEPAATVAALDPDKGGA
jgi:NADH-quinone oxidoreductase subunit J